ncbi:hypothetical protein [Peribacillus frigoritolerans]|nr:hypothetical protein [Peribacillus frigoritolerans]WHX64196.1 hypothetical protein QNH33_11895 [Peribacillus frigoritolerans]
MKRNEEIVLQNKLLIRHDLIEEALTLIERESVIDKQISSFSSTKPYI